MAQRDVPKLAFVWFDCPACQGKFWRSLARVWLFSTAPGVHTPASRLPGERTDVTGTVIECGCGAVITRDDLLFFNGWETFVDEIPTYGITVDRRDVTGLRRRTL